MSKWEGLLTLGDLLLVMAYFGRSFMSPLKTIGKKAASMQGHLAGAERAFAVLDRLTDVHETEPTPGRWSRASKARWHSAGTSRFRLRR